jgi:hypothetical protein
VAEYRAKAIEDAKKEAEKIAKETEEKRQKILSKYQERRAALVQRALSLLNL